MNDSVTHIAAPECVITQVHPAVECGVVLARRRCGEEADAAMRRQHEAERQQQKRV